MTIHVVVDWDVNPQIKQSQSEAPMDKVASRHNRAMKYRKNPKISDPRKFAVITLKLNKMDFP